MSGEVHNDAGLSTEAPAYRAAQQGSGGDGDLSLVGQSVVLLLLLRL